MRKLSVYCLCFFVSASHSFSQQLQLTNYSSREGVPVYGTNSILQDGNGWMWFTSGYDVIRYDGSRFISYLPTSKTKMDYCFRLLEVDKEIWVVASPYLLKVSGDSLEKVDAEKNTPGILHAIGHRGKTYFLCEDGLYTLSKGFLTPIIKDAEITITHGEFLIPYNDSLMFSFQFNKRLVVFNLNRLSIHTVDLPVTDIKRESGRFYLFVKGTGIVALNEISLTGNTINLLSENIVLITDPEYERFAIDGRGSFWTYKLHQHLITLTPGKPVRVFNESNGLPSLWIHQLFVDREKNLWISSYSGLCKIQDANVDRYTINESLYSNVPVFLTRNIKSGQVIVGTEKGVSVFEDGRMKKIGQNNRPFNCRSLICAGSNYYYYRDSFLFSAKLDANRLIPVHERKLARIEGVGIDLTSDARNNVYLATTTGVFVYDGRQLTRILPDKTYFHNVYIDSGGRLWTGKFSGELTCYRVEHGPGSVRLTRALQVDSISPNIPRLHLIRALAEDGNGNIYVGTRYNGLFVLKMKEDKLLDVKHFGEENGISSNSVWSLSVDTAGACWIGTAKGLNLLKNQDGQWLVSDEGKKRQLKQATLVLTGDDNTVWIANHPGVVRIKNETRYSAGLFSTYVTSVMIAGKRLRSSQDNLKQFSYRNNNVAIEFSANTFLNEEDVLYSWRLHDKDEWSAPAPLHSVNYSALQPGKYNFRVRAIRSDGYWSANAAGFGFEILPPFWQQSWFFALATLLLLGGMYMLYRYRVQQLKKLYDMRNLIARDLHDEIGSTLTSINILSKVSQRNLENDRNKASDLLTKVIDQSQRIQQNMNDIVWAIKPDNDRIENMTVRMREYLSHTLEPKNISIHFMADENILQASFDMQQRRDFFLIFKEAINNIAKYSQCKQARINLSRKNGHISLVIEDDGIGFNMNSVHSTGGLVNMEKRAALMKGRFEIKSTPGEGTKIELLVPAT